MPPRDRVVIAASIGLVTLLAWMYLLHLAHGMQPTATSPRAMASMAMTPSVSWSVTDYFFTFAMWSVMMVGMMSPTVAPVLLLFARMHKGRDQRSGSANALLFGLGYIIVWVGFSALAALAQSLLHEAALLSAGTAAVSARTSGAILLLAGAYQLTPAKNACLRQCQSPLGFLMSNWREGRRGALHMGFDHGTYCVGCCWALMCVLFAVGVMNLAWVAALTIFILVEKFSGSGWQITRIAGVAMIALGALVIARPSTL